MVEQNVISYCKSITVEKSQPSSVISSLGKARDTWLVSQDSLYPLALVSSGELSRW
jgi:prophage antirepressor-like protein